MGLPLVCVWTALAYLIGSLIKQIWRADSRALRVWIFPIFFSFYDPKRLLGELLIWCSCGWLLYVYWSSDWDWHSRNAISDVFSWRIFFLWIQDDGKGRRRRRDTAYIFFFNCFRLFLFLPRERLTHKQHRMSELHISSPVILLGVCKALARRASFGLAWPHTAGICSSHLFICHFLRISSRILRPDTVIRFWIRWAFCPLLKL